MAPDTRGQQLLPGDPEGLLRAERPQMVARNQGIAAYVALSVTVAPDGAVTVRRLRLDSATRRVVPELLDVIPPEDARRLSPAEYLRYWAHQQVLDSWDTPE